MSEEELKNCGDLILKNIEEQANHETNLMLQNKKYKEVLDKIKEYIKEDMYGEPNELYGLVDGEHILELLEEIE